jgi:hypothetical protein
MVRVAEISFVAASSALVVALIVSAGCGGSAFTASDAGAAPEDARTDTAAPESGSPESGPSACILPPNGVDGEGAFCSFLSAKWSACGNCEACHQLDENDCVSLGDSLSDGFKNALETCAPKLACADLAGLSGLANDPCVRAQLAAMRPNSAQQAVQMAYCQACPANMAECQTFFDLTPDAGTTAGYGIWALAVDEALDQQIVATCSGSTPHCDALGYGVCAGLLFCGKAPHSHCMHGLCN